MWWSHHRLDLFVLQYLKVLQNTRWYITKGVARNNTLSGTYLWIPPFKIMLINQCNDVNFRIGSLLVGIYVRNVKIKVRSSVDRKRTASVPHEIVFNLYEHFYQYVFHSAIPLSIKLFFLFKYVASSILSNAQDPGIYACIQYLTSKFYVTACKDQVRWGQQTSYWSKVALSSVGFCGTHLTPVS